jgi:hypothetical protein
MIRNVIESSELYNDGRRARILDDLIFNNNNYILTNENPIILKLPMFRTSKSKANLHILIFT